MSCKTFTYSNDPSKSDRDAVRFMVGDTNKDRPLFDDREIDYQLTATPNVAIAASELLFAKAAEFATQADIRVGDVSKSLSKVSENLKACAERLKSDALLRARPFFGGLTKSGKRALAEDTGATQPQFFLGQTDDPQVIQLNRELDTLYCLNGYGG